MTIGWERTRIKDPLHTLSLATNLSRPPTRAMLNMTETLALEPAQGPSSAPRVTVGFDLGTASLKAEIYCPSLKSYTTVDNWPSEKRHNDYGRGIMPQAKTLSLYFEKPDPSSDADHFFGFCPHGPGLRGLKLSLDNCQIKHWGQQQIAREFREECESHGLKPDTLFTELLITATKTIRDFLAERGWVWATTGLTVSSIFTRPDTASRKIQACTDQRLTKLVCPMCKSSQKASATPSGYCAPTRSNPPKQSRAPSCS